VPTKEPTNFSTFLITLSVHLASCKSLMRPTALYNLAFLFIDGGMIYRAMHGR
jgi:hypothetical protein